MREIRDLKLTFNGEKVTRRERARERERGANEERIGCAWINFTLQTLVTVVQAYIPPRRSKI